MDDPGLGIVNCGFCHSIVKDPRILKCLHIVCLSCLHYNSKTDIISCKVCGVSTNNTQGLDALPECHSFVQAALDVKSTEPACVHHNETVSIHCETCDTYLCLSCLNGKHGDHVTVSVKYVLKTLLERLKNVINDRVDKDTTKNPDSESTPHLDLDKQRLILENMKQLVEYVSKHFGEMSCVELIKAVKRSLNDHGCTNYERKSSFGEMKPAIFANDLTDLLQDSDLTSTTDSHLHCLSGEPTESDVTSTGFSNTNRKLYQFVIIPGIIVLLAVALNFILPNIYQLHYGNTEHPIEDPIESTTKETETVFFPYCDEYDTNILSFRKDYLWRVCGSKLTLYLLKHTSAIHTSYPVEAPEYVHIKDGFMVDDETFVFLYFGDITNNTKIDVGMWNIRTYSNGETNKLKVMNKYSDVLFQEKEMHRHIEGIVMIGKSSIGVLLDNPTEIVICNSRLAKVKSILLNINLTLTAFPHIEYSHNRFYINSLDGKIYIASDDGTYIKALHINTDIKGFGFSNNNLFVATSETIRRYRNEYDDFSTVWTTDDKIGHMYVVGNVIIVELIPSNGNKKESETKIIGISTLEI